MSSLIEAILKNQFKQVSLAVSLTLSGEKLSGEKTTQKQLHSFWKQILQINNIFHVRFKTVFSFHSSEN